MEFFEFFFSSIIGYVKPAAFTFYDKHRIAVFVCYHARYNGSYAHPADDSQRRIIRYQTYR